MKRSNQGMTLLEVLVALAIFATAALSVMRSVTQHISTLSFLEEKTLAAMVVDNQMALVMLAPAPTTTKKGKAELANQTWYWKVEPIKTSSNLLRAVDVSVATDKAHKNTLLTVRSYVAP